GEALGTGGVRAGGEAGRQERQQTEAGRAHACNSARIGGRCALSSLPAAPRPANGVYDPRRHLLVPKLCLGTPAAKLCFAGLTREAELRGARSQAELGNEIICGGRRMPRGRSAAPRRRGPAT